MKDDFYGVTNFNSVNTKAERVSEEVLINGWSKVEKVVGRSELNRLRQLIDNIYQMQEAEFGRDVLLRCNEADQARCLTRYDKIFLQLAKIPQIAVIVNALLGNYYILLLQNAVINRPGSKHHQSAWHRDLPYQNFVSSEPLAINMLLVIDTFDLQTGGTELLPYSHKLSQLPSESYIEKHKISATAEPGDVLFFDSMLYHRSGINRSCHTRRALNTQFSKPFIKSQYALHSIVPSEFIDNEDDRRLLGMNSATVTDERQWRINRINRLQGKS